MNKKGSVSPGFTDRINAFIRANCLRAIDVSKVLGISQGALSHVLSGRSYLAVPNIRKLVDAYGLNANWLLAGRGPMMIPPGNPAMVTENWDVDEHPEDQALEQRISDEIRFSLWEQKKTVDSAQLPALRELVRRMSYSLGRPPDTCIFRLLFMLSDGPSPHERTISGEPRRPELEEGGEKKEPLEGKPDPGHAHT